MEKKIKQLLRYLQIEYVAVWVLPLLLVALYETGVMTEGAYAGDVRMDYVLQTVGILLAGGGVKPGEIGGKKEKRDATKEI